MNLIEKALKTVSNKSDVKEPIAEARIALNAMSNDIKNLTGVALSKEKIEALSDKDFKQIENSLLKAFAAKEELKKLVDKLK